MQRSGIVMKLADKTAILMTPTGDFLKVKRQPFMEVGMEVPVVASIVQGRQRRTPVWQRLGAAAVAACLVLGAGTWYELGHASKAYAYVSVDINPSLAFTVDRSEHVLDITGLNADGKRLAAQLQVVHEPLQVAIQDTVQQAADDQLMAADDTILVTAAPADAGQDISSLTATVRTEVQTAISQSPRVKALKPSVYSLQVSNTVWKAATQKHISPGKLYTYLLAHEEGQQLPLDKIDGPVVGNIIKSSGPAGKVLEQALKTGNPDAIRSVIQDLGPAGALPGAMANSTVDNPDNNTTDGQTSGTRQAGMTDNGTASGKKKSGKNHGRGQRAHSANTRDAEGKSGGSTGVTITIDGTTIHVTVSGVPQSATGSGTTAVTSSQSTANATANGASGQEQAPTWNAPATGNTDGSWDSTTDSMH